MQNKKYPNLISGNRPSEYDYETKELISNGYIHFHRIDFEDPDFENVIKNLDATKQNYRIVTPKNRRRMRDVWKIIVNSKENIFTRWSVFSNLECKSFSASG